MRFSVRDSGFSRLINRRQEERLREAAAEFLEEQGQETAEAARRHLQPIYNDAGRKAWAVTGALRRSIKVEFDWDSLAVRLVSDLPYSRRRHFENRAHPQATGFLSIPLFEQRDKMIAKLKKIFYKNLRQP